METGRRPEVSPLVSLFARIQTPILAPSHTGGKRIARARFCRQSLPPESNASLYTASMVKTPIQIMWPRSFSEAPVALAILAVAFFASGARGQEQQPLNASDVADGMRLYQQKE